jgi:hypothetical protein
VYFAARPWTPLLVGLVVLVSLLGSVLAGSARAAMDPAAVSGLRTNSQALLGTVINSYASTAGPYANGVWGTPDPTCWGCDNGGPATAAATLFVLTGRSNATLLTMAERTVDRLVATRQSADGGFEDVPGVSSSENEVANLFFGVEFGTIYQLLLPNLSAAEAVRWQRSLAAEADWLVRGKNLVWYTNGNINVALVEFMYLVWKATAQPQYLQDYNQAWTFLVSPPQNLWPGAGLILTKVPHAADGSDGAGYLTETGAGGRGFDAEYTSLQLDVTSRLYLLSGDPRALRLTNLLLNQLMPRINSQFLLDTSGGTRHPEVGRQVDFMTSAFTVLSLFGGRSDLASKAAAELNAETADYTTQPWQTYNPVFRRALGNDVSASALADALGLSSHTLQNQLPGTPTIGIAMIRALGAKATASSSTRKAGAVKPVPAPSRSRTQHRVQRARGASRPRSARRLRAGRRHRRIVGAPPRVS